MNNDLFRKEALEARSVSWLGSIRLARPLRGQLITVAALAAAAAFVAFMIWGQYPRVEVAPGVLTPGGGIVLVEAPQQSVVQDLRVAEGSVVTAGQTLLALSADRTTSNGSVTSALALSISAQKDAFGHQSQVHEAEAQVREESLALREVSLRSDIESIRRELSRLAARVELGDEAVSRYEDLFRNGFLGELQLRQKRDEQHDLRERYGDRKRALAAAERDLSDVQAQRRLSGLKLKQARLELRRNVTLLDQQQAESESRGSWTIQAPVSGTVSVLNVHVGKTVAGGATLAAITPAGALVASIYAPSRSVGFVRPGQEVRLRLASYPYQKYGVWLARVEAISGTPINPTDLPAGHAAGLLAAAGANEPLYRITASLLERPTVPGRQEEALKGGMALDAVLVQESRSLYEWLLSPLFALRRNQ